MRDDEKEYLSNLTAPQLVAEAIEVILTAFKRQENAKHIEQEVEQLEVIQAMLSALAATK